MPLRRLALEEVKAGHIGEKPLADERSACVAMDSVVSDPAWLIGRESHRRSNHARPCFSKSRGLAPRTPFDAR